MALDFLSLTFLSMWHAVVDFHNAHYRYVACMYCGVRYAQVGSYF